MRESRLEKASEMQCDWPRANGSLASRNNVVRPLGSSITQASYDGMNEAPLSLSGD